MHHTHACGRAAFRAASHRAGEVYEPEWLAGTNVGELMFQADYHLKEPDGETFLALR